MPRSAPSSPWASPLWGAFLVGAYALLVIAPVAFVGIIRPPTDHGFVYSVGKNFALCAFTILALQFVLSARIRWIERPFGLDSLLRFHKAMAMVATGLLLSHPLLLAAGSEWSLLWDVDASWHIKLGGAALAVLLAHVVVSICRRVLKLEYQAWRRLHNVLALGLLLLAFLHSWLAGGDLSLVALRVLWVWLLLFALGAWFWHRIVQPRWVNGSRYQVSEVVREAADVWTIKLKPPPGTKRFDFLPGQFGFLTFDRPGLVSEEHHWTIASAPTQEGFIATTIKESGDFTATIGQTKPGHSAWVEGPFGRFSYLLHPTERDLVFIAGGIGITPLMSMLRHMRDQGDERRVLLVTTNSRVEDVIFATELEEMVRAGKPALEILQMVSDAPADWGGERGRLDEERVERLCAGERQKRGYYICAPGPLSEMIMRTLRRQGVPSRSIHCELFRI